MKAGPMKAGPMKAGIVGCGVISGVYFATSKRLEALEVVGCNDLDVARAKEAAEQHGVRLFASLEDMLDDEEVELVVNLTPPSAHVEVSLAALGAGKHLYTEKPLASSRAGARRIMALAAERGLLVGSAPDTFLGGGLQACRRIVDSGVLGKPLAAAAFLLGRGPEGWHPNPEFFFKKGAGPLFDIGPYYLTALVNLLGPVARVSASVATGQLERVVGTGARAGEGFAVEVPTHVAGLLEFGAGVVVTMIMSFDAWASELPRIELYGVDGTLSCPSPNTFGGPVRVARRGHEGWSEVEIEGPYLDQSRGIGAAELARAARSGEAPRASGELAYHVLDVMEALLEAAESGTWMAVESTCERPAPLSGATREGVVA
ncbi:MAG: Gfo/Idh/MocA family protein [Acidimicrobiales bacterium]